MAISGPQTFANVMHFGAVADGTTNDAPAFNAALATGKPVFAPAGDYAIGATLTIPNAYSGIIGVGQATQLLYTPTNGTACIDINEFDQCTLRDLHISHSTGARANYVGIDSTWGNRYHFENVRISYAATAINCTTAHIGTFTNVFIWDCALGIDGDAMNSVSGNIFMEECDQGFNIVDSYGVWLDILDEGTPPTSASVIDNTQNIHLNCYWEVGAGQNRTVPRLSIGPTGECRDVVVSLINSNYAGETQPVVAVDRVNGCEISGFIFPRDAANAITQTSNTYNLTLKLAEFSGRRVQAPAGYSNLPAINHWPDSGFDGGIPASLIDSDAISASETTEVPAGYTTSLKVSAVVNGASTSSFAYKVFTFADYPALASLKGKTVGFGWWVKGEAGANYTYDTNGPDIRVLPNGTGVVESNRYKYYAPGGWYWQSSEVNVPADATQITLYYYANRGTVVNEANMIAYFVGPWVWPGGNRNSLKTPWAISSAPFPPVSQITVEGSPGAGDLLYAAKSDGRLRVVDVGVLLANLLTGTGTPESAVTAPVGTLYLRTDGSTSTTLYVKETGTGNTGWIAK